MLSSVSTSIYGRWDQDSSSQVEHEVFSTTCSGGSRISRRGGVDLMGGGAVDPRGGYILKILHVKTKESGHVWGGGGTLGAPPRSANDLCLKKVRRAGEMPGHKWGPSLFQWQHFRPITTLLLKLPQTRSRLLKRCTKINKIEPREKLWVMVSGVHQSETWL